MIPLEIANAVAKLGHGIELYVYTLNTGRLPTTAFGVLFLTG